MTLSMTQIPRDVHVERGVLDLVGQRDVVSNDSIWNRSQAK